MKPALGGRHGPLARASGLPNRRAMGLEVRVSRPGQIRKSGDCSPRRPTTAALASQNASHGGSKTRKAAPNAC